MKSTFPFLMFLLLLASCGPEMEEAAPEPRCRVLTETVSTYRRSSGPQPTLESTQVLTYTYDDRRNPVKVSSYYERSPDSQTIHIYEEEMTYEYDDGGRIVSALEERWDRPSGVREFTYLRKTAYSYNGRGQVTRSQSYRWNESEGFWLVGTTDYVYSGERKLGSSVSYWPDSPNSNRRTFQYTGDVMDSATEAHYQGDTLRYRATATLTYDRKRSPVSASPALAAISLGYGYPMRHNIIEQRVTSADGWLSQPNSRRHKYTYNPEGYPLLKETEPLQDNFRTYKTEYSYACE